MTFQPGTSFTVSDTVLSHSFLLLLLLLLFFSRSSGVFCLLEVLGIGSAFFFVVVLVRNSGSSDKNSGSSDRQKLR